jgi:hypothetical protein
MHSYFTGTGNFTVIQDLGMREHSGIAVADFYNDGILYLTPFLRINNFHISQEH